MLLEEFSSLKNLSIFLGFAHAFYIKRTMILFDGGSLLFNEALYTQIAVELWDVIFGILPFLDI